MIKGLLLSLSQKAVLPAAFIHFTIAITPAVVSQLFCHSCTIEAVQQTYAFPESCLQQFPFLCMDLSCCCFNLSRPERSGAEPGQPGGPGLGSRSGWVLGPQARIDEKRRQVPFNKSGEANQGRRLDGSSFGTVVTLIVGTGVLARNN